MQIARGVFKESSGVIDAPIGRNPNDRKKMGVVKNGRHAVTHYKVIKQLDDCAILEVKLETGRTHQIRVHMAYINHPVVNDIVYGHGKIIDREFGQMLHAKEIGFIHPITKEFMDFQVEAPKRFMEILEEFKNK